ncbi:MAG: DUF1189 family protein [Candidatus Taylorbacteria bacterium]|nr:DUF1189 family protein [Candidatus Taylorbacteria bacterium]
MREFLDRAVRSAYDSSLYAQVAKEPPSAAFKYYARLGTFLSVASAIVLTALFLPTYFAIFSSDSIDGLLSLFPAELKIIVKNGQAATNVREPYFVKMPENHPFLKPKSGIDNIFTLNTRLTRLNFSLAAFESYKTFILITKDAVVYKDPNHRITVEPLSRFPDMEVSRESLTNLTSKVRKWGTLIIPGAAIGLAVLGLLKYASYLVFFALLAFIVYLLNFARGLKLNFGLTYRYILYAATAGLALDFFLNPLVSPAFSLMLISAAAIIIALTKARAAERKKPAI